MCVETSIRQTMSCPPWMPGTRHLPFHFFPLRSFFFSPGFWGYIMDLTVDPKLVSVDCLEV